MVKNTIVSVTADERLAPGDFCIVRLVDDQLHARLSDAARDGKFNALALKPTLEKEKTPMLVSEDALVELYLNETHS